MRIAIIRAADKDLLEAINYQVPFEHLQFLFTRWDCFKSTTRCPLLWLVSDFCEGINIKITSICMWKPGWPSG